LGNIYLSNPFNLGNLRLKNLSIKNIKLCETNPISGTPKMNLTHYSTNRYDNNSGLLTMQKRTQNEPNQSQSKPILPPYMAGKIALSLSKGSNPFYPPELKQHTVCENRCEVFFIGDFDILDFASQLFGQRPVITAQENHLCAGGCGVADKMNPLNRDIGQ